MILHFILLFSLIAACNPPEGQQRAIGDNSGGNSGSDEEESVAEPSVISGGYIDTDCSNTTADATGVDILCEIKLEKKPIFFGTGGDVNLSPEWKLYVTTLDNTEDNDVKMSPDSFNNVMSGVGSGATKIIEAVTSASPPNYGLVVSLRDGQWAEQLLEFFATGNNIDKFSVILNIDYTPKTDSKKAGPAVLKRCLLARYLLEMDKEKLVPPTSDQVLGALVQENLATWAQESACQTQNAFDDWKPFGRALGLLIEDYLETNDVFLDVDK